MAKGSKGSSGSGGYSGTTAYDREDTTPGNRRNDTTPNSAGEVYRSNFTIEPIGRATGGSAEEAIRKTHRSDER